jgi:hypothetical protein
MLQEICLFIQRVEPERANEQNNQQSSPVDFDILLLSIVDFGISLIKQM